jgi:trans-aconitate methyltransferase
MDNQSVIPNYDQIWTQVYGSMQHAGPVHRHLKRLVQKVLAQLEYDSVLDIGCGPGYNLPLLTQGRFLKRITGVDVSAWAIAQAQKTEHDEFYVLDIQQERLNGIWDLVYCSLVLEHLPDDLAALSHMRAMTAKFLLVTTIAGDFERYKAWDQRMGHVRNYHRGELEEKMHKFGLRIQQAVYWGFPFYSPCMRVFQNYIQAGTGQFGLAERLISQVLYYLYFLNSRRNGDLLVVLATV